MNYKRMWLALKKIIEEEDDILSGELKNTNQENRDRLTVQAEEVDYLAGEMKILEAREILLQEKEKYEEKNEGN
ncbi:hypothetical protein X813_gp40 [Lactobacillus phage LL-Ku]|uniref:Uncharacterized protein n=1 Tax=Lactobacillus phage LL-Ku TaxID=2892343 RepID=F7V9E0_9CAUD|nr:hypothetical protein X813_gp40 [Lactobacillus phage LL-Ku]AAV30201.1 hypothetical protein [Lactobacillus phage LL-Ku]